MALNKVLKRRKIRYRIRKKISGTSTRPRIAIFRSNKAIYAQMIDDVAGVTLVSASSQDGSVDSSKNKSDQAKEVGKILGEKAKAAGIDTAVFDRGGYLYHGRVKALADGTREAGINF